MGRFLSALFFLFVLASSVSAQTHLRLQNQPQHLNFLITYHTAAPTVNDDKNDGYVVGSTWIDTVAGTVYHATSVAAGAAVWFQAQAYFITSILEDSDSVNFTKNIEIGTTTNSVQLIRGAGITGTKGYTLAINCNCDVAVSTGTLTDANLAIFNSQGTIINGPPSAAMRVRTCEITAGDPAQLLLFLADDNDSPGVCGNDSGVTMTITAVHCYAPTGSPTVTPIISGGSSTSILTGALTCSSTAGGAAGTLNGTPTQTDGQTIDGNITTAGGVAKYLVIRITRTLPAS